MSQIELPIRTVEVGGVQREYMVIELREHLMEVFPVQYQQLYKEYGQSLPDRWFVTQQDIDDWSAVYKTFNLGKMVQAIQYGLTPDRASMLIQTKVVTGFPPAAMRGASRSLTKILVEAQRDGVDLDPVKFLHRVRYLQERVTREKKTRRFSRDFSRNGVSLYSIAYQTGLDVRDALGDREVFTENSRILWGHLASYIDHADIVRRPRFRSDVILQRSVAIMRHCEEVGLSEDDASLLMFDYLSSEQLKAELTEQGDQAILQIAHQRADVNDPPMERLAEIDTHEKVEALHAAVLAEEKHPEKKWILPLVDVAVSYQGKQVPLEWLLM